MENTEAKASYHIWGADNAAYGPVELPMLVDWVNEHRVIASTWIYLEPKAAWTKASEVPELQMFFSSSAPEPVVSKSISKVLPSGLEPRSLRRIKILATLSDPELSTLINYIEVQEFKNFAQVVRVGEHGDAMYLILSGELRARTLSSDGKETTLATMGVGDYFGEISLLDEGPRSADVLANADSVVLKLSSESFEKLRKEVPQLGLHFMYALGRSAAGKIRNLTKRYQDSIQFSRYVR